MAVAFRPTRRALLIGGGVGAGLALAWELWPRDYPANLAAGPGETVLAACLRIDTAGRVTVAVPQAELGQGIWTALPQALADELGADWRQVGVEPAPANPLFANRVLAEQWAAGLWPDWVDGAATRLAGEWATRHAFIATSGAASVRGLELAFRQAGATARALLCMAAGQRLGADWRACDTAEGLVVRGPDRFRFGELAAAAAGFTPPAVPPLRRPGEGGLSGRPLPRLDAAAKVDGSWRYTGDVRLPGMVYAAINGGPAGDTRLAAADPAPADAIAGVVGVVRTDRWVAALAQTSWAAERAVRATDPRFATADAPDDAGIARALTDALARPATRLVTVGAPDPLLAGPEVIRADYATGLLPHALVETLTATARVSGDRLEIWLPSQAPTLHRDLIARATGFSPAAVILYPMPAGGGFNRKLEADAGIAAAQLAIQARRPVQLRWSWGEELRRGRHRAPIRARLAARPLAGGRIAAWSATVAAPATLGDLVDRLGVSAPARPAAAPAALDGARPPYRIPAVALALAPATLPVSTGLWPGDAHAHLAFFTESFVDELAVAASADPLGFRIGLLGGNPRLARCLAQVASLGGWTGEPGSGQGLACHSAYGSHIACLAEARLDDGRPRVTRLVAAVDCGRMVNPDIVAQQIEGGLLWGQGMVAGHALRLRAGLPDVTDVAGLRLPSLRDTGEVRVELLPSAAAPGGVADLGITVAPAAIGNALFSATGTRLRALPLA